jgi:hypothetical protein
VRSPPNTPSRSLSEGGDQSVPQRDPSIGL